MAVYLTEIPVDLALPPRQYPMPHQFAMGDNNAYTITSLLYDSRTPDMELLDGTVSGELVRPDGETVALTGEKGEEVRVINADQGGMCNATPCSVTLPQACFAYPGRVTLTIKLTDGTTITQALSMSAVVVRTSTDVVVDPGEVVPDIGALQAAAAEALDAAEAATAAADHAVQYDAAQTLTVAQQAQARENIGAADEAAFEAITGYAPTGANGTVTRRGITITGNGTTVTISGTATSSSAVRYSSTVEMTAYSTPQMVEWGETGTVPVVRGQIYEFHFLVVSGTISGGTINIYGPGGWQALSSGLQLNTSPKIVFTAETDYVAVVGYIGNGMTTDGNPAVVEMTLTAVNADNLAPQETTVAGNQHATGDLLTVGGTLYKATQAIAPGVTINSTNVVETTVAAQLAALEARIAALEG